MLRHIGLLVLVFALRATDGHAEHYLVLPILGDRITTITREPQKDAPDSYRTQFTPRDTPTLDNYVLRAVQFSIQTTRPDTTITMLRAADPKMFALRDALVETDTMNIHDMWLLLARQPAASSASHLLLIVPYVAELRMSVPGGDLRSINKAAGLGLYVDAETRMRRHDTHEAVAGFLGVFANFQLMLIDLAREEVTARERIAVGQVFTDSFRGADKTPLEALSPGRKDAAFAFLLTEEIQRALPEMLKAR